MWHSNRSVTTWLAWFVVPVLAAGCALRGTMPAPVEVPPVEPVQDETREEVPPPAVTNPTPPGPDELIEIAGRDLAVGDYPAAIATYRALVAGHPHSPQAPQALFQLAALHWNPASPNYDPGEAFANLRRIAQEHPDSAWAPAAAAVLAMARDKAGLERALATMRAQLEELKQLDLEPPG